MKISVELVADVEVELDETKFTPEFMQEFREQFYTLDTIEDHARHIGWMYLRGLTNLDGFIEGYGYSAEMGIRFREG